MKDKNTNEVNIIRDKLPLMQKGKFDLLMNLRADILNGSLKTAKDMIIRIEQELIKIELKYQPKKR